MALYIQKYNKYCSKKFKLTFIVTDFHKYGRFIDENDYLFFLLKLFQC